ncbi:MAG: hypothetical protein ACE5ID_12775, partial [Acidobacteriota bacterium]
SGRARQCTRQSADSVTATNAYLAATRSDKKARQGQVEYVLIQSIGQLARDDRRRKAWSWPLKDQDIRKILFPGG